MLDLAIWLSFCVVAPTSGPSRPLDVSAVGDIIFGWYTADGYRELTDADVFADVTDSLRADVVLGNLETPLSAVLPDRSPLSRGFRFGAQPRVLAWLGDAGFTGLSIANNHAVDLSADGLSQTADCIRAAGLTPLGSPSVGGVVGVDTLTIDGWRVAVVAATTWLNAPVPAGARVPPLVSSRRLAAELAPVVRLAAADHDLVIVSLHWGRESTAAPEHHQRRVARAVAEAGADFVWGHHAHVLQGVEWIGDTVVAYSLGNFVFYSRGDVAARDSAILRLTRSPAGEWTEATLVPIGIDETTNLHPRPAERLQARRIRQTLRRASAKLGTRWEPTAEGTLRLWRPAPVAP